MTTGLKTRHLFAPTNSPGSALHFTADLNYEDEALSTLPDMNDPEPTPEPGPDPSPITYAPLCSTVPSTGCALTVQTECKDNTLPQGCTVGGPSCSTPVTSVTDCTKASKGCNKLTLPSACSGVTSVSGCTLAAAWCNVFTLPSACATSESGCYTNAGNCDTLGRFCQQITVKAGLGCTSVPAQCNATFNTGNSCAPTKNLDCINTKAAACATSATPSCVQTSHYACQNTFGLRCLTYSGKICTSGPVMPAPVATPESTSLILIVAVTGLFAALASANRGS